jgi:hypothetical protein
MYLQQNQRDNVSEEYYDEYKNRLRTNNVVGDGRNWQIDEINVND